MDKIFANASQVLIWLGEPPSGERMPLELMQLLINTIYIPLKVEENKMFATRFKTMSNADLERNLGIPPPDSSDWRDARSLLRNLWFERAWVYQEVMLARNAQVIYGPDSVTFSPKKDEYPMGFSPFVYAVEYLSHRHVADVSSAPYTQHFRGVGAKRLCVDYDLRRDEDYPYSRELLTLMRRQRSCKDTDPRDKVFAVLGIASDRSQLGFFPDYTASLTRVYTHTASDIIKNDGNLDILHCVELHDRSSSELPSWVPDWRQSFTASEHHLLYNERATQYRTTGCSRVVRNEGSNMSRLSLQGVKFDAIHRLGPVAWYEPKKALNAVVLDGGGWSQIATESFPGGFYAATGESVGQAFARTRIWDRQWQPSKRRKRLTRTEYRTLPEIAFQEGSGNLRDLLIRDSIDRLVRDKTRNQVFFITSKVYMGLGPHGMQEGDQIYLLLGGLLPFVLRPNPDDSTFKLVGICYVHGIMDGEGLLEARARQDPTYDKSNTAWLNELGKGPFPFETEEVVLV